MSVLEWESNPQPVAAVCATDDVVMTIDGSATLRAFDADGGALGVVTMEATAVETDEPSTPAWTGIALCGGDDSVIVLCDAANARVCVFVCTDQMLVEPLHEVADLRPIHAEDGSPWLLSPRGVTVDEARGVIVVADAGCESALAIVVPKPLADLLRHGGTAESVTSVTTELKRFATQSVVACELVGMSKPQAVAALAVSAPAKPTTEVGSHENPTLEAPYKLVVTVADTGSHSVRVYGLDAACIHRAVASFANSSASSHIAERLQPAWTLGGPGRSDGQLVHPLGVMLWHPANFDDEQLIQDAASAQEQEQADGPTGKPKPSIAAQRRQRAALGVDPLPLLEDVSLVVSDAGNGRLQAWPLTGEQDAGVLWIIEYTGQGEEEKLSRPSCVCLSGDGEALVVDETHGVWVMLPDDVTGDLPTGSAGRAMIYGADGMEGEAGEKANATAKSSGGTSSNGGFGATAQSAWPEGGSPSGSTLKRSGDGSDGLSKPLVHHPAAAVAADSGHSPGVSGPEGVPSGSAAWDAGLDASSSDDSFLREARANLATDPSKQSKRAHSDDDEDGRNDDDDVRDVASLLGGGEQGEDDDEDLRLAQTRSPAQRPRPGVSPNLTAVPTSVGRQRWSSGGITRQTEDEDAAAAADAAADDADDADDDDDDEHEFHGAIPQSSPHRAAAADNVERRRQLGLRSPHDSYVAPAWAPRREDEYYPPESWRARQLDVHPPGRGPKEARNRLRKRRQARRAAQPRMRRGAGAAGAGRRRTRRRGGGNVLMPESASLSTSLGSTAVLPQYTPPSMLPANLRQDDDDVRDAGRALLREMLELEQAEIKQHHRLRRAIARNEGKVAELAELAPALAVVGSKPKPTPMSALTLSSAGAGAGARADDIVPLPALPRWRSEDDVPAVPEYEGRCWEEAALRARLIELSAALKLATRDHTEWDRVGRAPVGRVKHLEELLGQVESATTEEDKSGIAAEPVTIAELSAALREADERCEVAQIRLGEVEDTSAAMQGAWDIERRRLQLSADRARDSAEGSRKSVEAVLAEAAAMERHVRLLEEEAAELAQRGKLERAHEQDNHTSPRTEHSVGLATVPEVVEG